MPDLSLWTPDEALPCRCEVGDIGCGIHESGEEEHNPAPAVRVAVDPWACRTCGEQDTENPEHSTAKNCPDVEVGLTTCCHYFNPPQDGVVHNLLAACAAHPDTDFHVWTDVAEATIWWLRHPDESEEDWPPTNLILHPKEAPDG